MSIFDWKTVGSSLFLTKLNKMNPGRIRSLCMNWINPIFRSIVYLLPFFGMELIIKKQSDWTYLESIKN